MIFNTHSHLAGSHAFLSASKYSWLNYDDEKLDTTYLNALAARRGDELHQLAYNLIRLKEKLPRTVRTLNMYVNDAIGYRMVPEQVLYYSDNCFGTADTIKFDGKKLRIHDLKTGRTPCKFDQLEIYGGIFCLEYGFKPAEIQMEFRIYQNDEIFTLEGDYDRITRIMEKIKRFDERINRIREEALL